MADVGVEYGNRVRGAVHRLERRRQIVGDTLAHIAHPRDLRGFTPAADERLSIRAPAERNDVWRKLKAASPSVQRIMIAVNNENGNAALGQSFHLFAERNERT